MKISAKAGLNLEQLQPVLDLGLPYIEFHTNYSDFDGSIDFHKVRNILDLNNVTCLTLHVPISDLNNSFATIGIGTLYQSERKKNMELYKKCIQSVNILSSSRNPVVVTHIGTCFELEDKEYNCLSKEAIDTILKDAISDLIEINTYIQENYPNTIFAVENMPHFAYGQNDTIFGWYFGKEHDLPKYIGDLNLSNIKTCLDTCHVEMTIRASKLINPYKKDSIRDYVKSYAPVLGQIHLNNTINLGETGNVHSQPFKADNKEDIEFLKVFFDDILKYGVDCPITLEINEIDYIKRANLSATIDAIVAVCKDSQNIGLKETLTKRNIISID